MTKDTQIGQWLTGSTTLSAALPAGGYVLCSEAPPNYGVITTKVWPPCEIPNTKEFVDSNGGYPDNNPKTSFGAKKLPLELVPPSAVAALAEAFADGAKKYGPYNWRSKSISSSIYYGACLRHIQAWWDGEDFAEDSGIHHLHHALACIAMVIDGASVNKLNDNRPLKGAASKIQRDWISKHEAVGKDWIEKFDEKQNG